MDLRRVAYALASTGHAVRAATLLGRATALLEEIGARLSWVSWVAEENDRALSAVHTRLDDATFADAWEHGRALTVDEAIAHALDPTDGEAH